ncbi:NADP(H)-dependent aldo-keto reductase [Spiribacter sp. C176]|uniref:Protein tas n=1 Tax=Spiribacter salilacus TaxID=2664894 RepID=A0A6N7QTI3_9GAMM|nr:NADP(H)-dependent aldo-keto reductase [Spiribacter salilacus]MRH78900.1 NADP(H)-dependent aldo-keto reductase [Spiribacter salilacus]
MEQRPLGDSGLSVSALCLGTMTFGKQNTQADAFAQLDRAVAAGINFIDTAEMYPVPAEKQTQGETERMIGEWLKARGGRDDLVLATKIAGPGLGSMPHRTGDFNPKELNEAVDASLQRLQTDTIDLYQLHWPARQSNFFGRLGFTGSPKEPDPRPQMLATLEALQSLIDAGKIRYVGLSNESAWGTMSFLQLAAEHNLPRMVSVQNPYSLLNRSYEVGLAEVSQRENVGLLAYSPLAFGVLSGKYLDNDAPAGARLTLFEQFQRYSREPGVAATREYVNIAKRHGLDPSQMALAWVTSRPFVTSNIIGVTTLEQLEINLASDQLTLSDAVIEEIEAVHAAQSNPCP